MYISKNNGYTICDFNIENNDYFYLDENSELGKLYLENYPYVDFEQEDGIVTNIIVLEKPPINLEPLKYKKLIQSKQQLAEFLENNPLQFTDGKFYSVTKEKQTLLANALQVYQIKVQAGLPATLKWNATGEECTEWTLEDLSALALVIAEYVEPLVTKQQALEVQIKNAQTLEELEAIEINYEVI